MLNKQMEDLRLADSKGDYTTTWQIIPDLSGKDKKSSVKVPKKGDLSLMTNYRGISLLSIAAKVYNKILLNRIRDHVDPILRSKQAGFRSGRSCAQEKSRKTKAPHQRVTKTYSLNGGNTSVPCSTTAMVNLYQNCHLLLLRIFP